MEVADGVSEQVDSAELIQLIEAVTTQKARTEWQELADNPS